MSRWNEEEPWREEKGELSCPGSLKYKKEALEWGAHQGREKTYCFGMGSPSTVSTHDHPSYGTEGSIRKRTGMSIRDTPSIYKETRRIWSTSGWPVMLQFQISMPAYCEGKCTSHLSWPDISRVVTGRLNTKACFIRSYTVWSRVWLVHLSKTTYIEDSTLHTYAYGYFAYHDKWYTD